MSGKVNYHQRNIVYVEKKINIILLNKIGKVVPPKRLSFKVDEIKKFLNSYYL